MFTASSRRPTDNLSNRPMKPGIRAMLLRPWFIVTAFVALAHQILQKILAISIPWADSFLDPLLFLPILLHLMLLERRFVFGLGGEYTFRWYHIFCTVALISLICELLFPYWSAAFTSDYNDVICYAIGGVVFGIFQNAPVKKY